MNPTSAAPETSLPRLGPAAAFVLLAAVAYIPALSGGFIWDDDAYVTANPELRTLEGLARIWRQPEATPQFYPLVFSTFWAEYHLWGLHPLGYHLVNVLLHGLNGILLWLLLRRLRVAAAWVVAAVFVLHPVQVESVAWITERKNVLSALCYFGSALAYFRFAPPEPLPEGTSRRWGWYALAVVLFLGALLSKTVTCSLPAALLLATWWRRGTVGWREVVPLAPLFVLGASLALVTVGVEKHHVGAVGEEWNLTPAQRVLVAGRAVCFYATKLCWPTTLTFIYPRWHVDAGAGWQYLFPVAALAPVVGLWLGRRRFGRGPLVAYLIYVGTLAPALGFIDFYPMRFSFVADHFQYLATPALLALLIAAGKTALDRLAPAAPSAPPVAAGAILLVLGVLTWGQGYVYADLRTLWTDTLTKNPDCWMAHNNLGEVFLEEGQLEEARYHYGEALRLNPRDPVAHYNVGKVFWMRGDADTAVRAFSEALRLDPDYAEAHFNLGLALRRQGKTEKAVAHFEEALRLRPAFGQAHNNLGVALAQLNRPAEAVPHFLAAAKSDPGDAGAYFNLALAHAQMGRRDDAIAYARQAVSLQPEAERFRQLLDGLLKEESDHGPKP